MRFKNQFAEKRSVDPMVEAASKVSSTVFTAGSVALAAGAAALGFGGASKAPLDGAPLPSHSLSTLARPSVCRVRFAVPLPALQHGRLLPAVTWQMLEISSPSHPLSPATHTDPDSPSPLKTPRYTFVCVGCHDAGPNSTWREAKKWATGRQPPEDTRSSPLF